jgi:ABC-type Fe3+/spermidine/putrescine transport system ATPase subunit
VQALSGGEQQRVALARALVIEPGVLLLDEPLSNLDPALRASTRAELRRLLTRRRVTALFVTHDQEDAFAVADRVAVLRQGRLLQVGPPEQLYDRPASRAVAEFLGRAALVPARVEGGAAAVRLGGVVQRVLVTRPSGTPADAPGPWLAVLRPEQLALSAPDAGADGGGDGRGDPAAWPGRVAARRFAGGTSVYEIACAAEGGGEVTLEVATPVRDAREGDRVGVRVERSPVAVVPAGADA